MLHTTYVGLVKLLEEDRKIFEARLSSGSIDKIEDYKLVVGNVQGINRSIASVTKLYKQLNS